MVYRTKKKYNSRKIKNKTKRNKTKRNKTKRKTIKLGGRPPSIFKPKNPTKPKIAWDNDKKKTKRKTVKLCGRPTSINKKNGGDGQIVPADSLTPTKKSWLPSWENVKHNTRKAWEKVKHNGSQFKKKGAITANQLQLSTGLYTSDNYRGSVFNLANKIDSYNSTHMDKYYGKTKITPECDAKTPKTCRCTSTEGRVQDLLNMLDKGGICTNCGEQCPRTQKILENYKRLNNDDLQSLPFTRFGRLLHNKSKFPAYYKGYMTPSRINSLIQTKIKDKEYNLEDYETGEIYIYYDKYGNTLSNCHNIFRSDTRNYDIGRCNNIIKDIQDKNKILDEDPNNTKKYILFKYGSRHKLLLVDKDIFTTKYRPEIIDIELAADDDDRSSMDSDRSSIYSDRSSMDSTDYVY